MQDRYNFVLDQIWNCILPSYERGFDGIAWWLGEKNRVNPPMINPKEIEDALRYYSALSIISSKKGRVIRANIGPNIFHVTSSDCLEDIAKQGLKLVSGDRDFSYELPPKEAVFLCKSPSYAACICGRAQKLNNQVVIEVERDNLNLHQVNSMGHDLGLVKEEDDLKHQLGCYEPIKPGSIVKVYLNNNNSQNVPEFFRDKCVLVDVNLPSKLKFKAKNTWTRAIAESMNIE